MNKTATMINSPVRTVKAKAEQYTGSALDNTYSYNDALVSINIDRVGEESKFFGFGVCQKANIKLRDLERSINITTANSFKLYLKENEIDGYISNFPIFDVTETNRDENTNQLSITAYDKIHKAEEHTVEELGLVGYTVREFADACAAIIGASGVEIIGVSDLACFSTYFESGANFEGTETIRTALNAVAEATQTIYYLNADNVLVFKRLDVSGQPVLTIGKADYITLDSKTNRRLSGVCHATELGDNVNGGLRKIVSGEAVRLDNVAPEEQVIKVRVEDANTLFARCGKNLAPKLQTTAINQGVTFEPVENGGIAVSGMPSGVSVCTLATIKPIVTTGKVTFSLTGNYINIVPDIKILNSAGHSIAQFQTGKTQVIDLDLYPDAATWIIAIKREANSVAVSGTVYVQLELGDKATEYEPFNIQTYTPEADGTVSGVIALYPTTTLYTSTNTPITAEYYQENSISGTIQYVRNNPFWDLREDIADLVDNALAAVHKLTINQFSCSWRGNYLLEVADKIALITKDDEEVISYIINDTLFYNGSLTETTSWNYADDTGATAANPTTIGEALNQTSAKVDKVNKEIELLASKNNTNEEAIASIRLDTENITSTVQKIDKTTQESIENLNAVTNNLSTELHQTATDIEISIQELREMEIDSVTTTTGFTFNQDGLTVTKSDSEIKTQITENGMTVYKDNQEVLIANNKGVQAIDLNASTYLIVGKNSRFEDYVSNRTGCFWIGG